MSFVSLTPPPQKRLPFPNTANSQGHGNLHPTRQTNIGPTMSRFKSQPQSLELRHSNYSNENGNFDRTHHKKQPERTDSTSSTDSTDSGIGLEFIDDDSSDSMDSTDRSDSTDSTESMDSMDSTGTDSDTGNQVAYEADRYDRHGENFDDLHENCPKNPGHNDFFPIRRRLNRLKAILSDASELCLDLTSEWIWLKSQETVKLEVKHTSPDRPDDLGFSEFKNSTATRYGSGTAFLLDMDKPQNCPFPDCNHHHQPHHVSGYFKVVTAGHVVFNDEEARNTTISFFDDDDSDTPKIVKARGVRVCAIDLVKNRSVVECVTHDLNLFATLNDFRKRREQLVEKFEPHNVRGDEKIMVVVISHPHGGSKRVTFGKMLQLVKYDEERARVNGLDVVSCQLSYTTPTCPGSGGGSVNIFHFQKGCIGFAPHCSCGEIEKEGISGLGWILNDTE